MTSTGTRPANTPRRGEEMRVESTRRLQPLFSDAKNALQKRATARSAVVCGTACCLFCAAACCLEAAAAAAVAVAVESPAQTPRTEPALRLPGPATDVCSGRRAEDSPLIG